MKNIFYFFVPYVRGVRIFQNYNFDCGKRKKDSVRGYALCVLCVSDNGCRT